MLSISIFLTLALGGPAAPQSPTSAPSNRILVMPFENVTRNSRIFWLGEASAVLLADDHPGQDLNVHGRNLSVFGTGQLLRNHLFDKVAVTVYSLRLSNHAEDFGGLLRLELP